MDKEKALAAALSQIERNFGKGSIMRLGENSSVEIETISTGSLGLDIALGIGGLPKGRIVEIFGPESSGKTTLALHVVAEAQRKGGICAFVDAEHALDPVYARKLGVNVDDLLISQPDTGEQALEITDTLVRSGAIDVLVVDSVAALTPRAELEGEMGDSLPGTQARLMSQAMRKLTGSISKSKCLVIFINQIREMAMSGDVMTMRRLEDGIAVPAGATVHLVPGGYHLMFMGLKAPLLEGEHVAVTLTFEKAGTAVIDLAVAGAAAAAPDDMEHGAMAH